MISTPRRVCTGTLIIFLNVGILSAQFWGTEAFVPANKGARGMAMGGCYVATAQGHEAFLKNPAALAFATGAEIGVGGRVIAFGSVKDEYLEEIFEEGLSSDDFSQKYEINPKIWDVSVSSDIPLPGRFSLGVGVSWAALYDNDYALRTSFTVQGTEYSLLLKRSGGFQVLTPAIGVAYDGKWAAGLAFGGAVFSPSGYRVEAEPELPFIENGTLTGTMKGSVTQLGLMAKPIDGLTLGANYTTPLEFSVEDQEWEPDSGLSEEIGDSDYEVPAQIVIGAAYDITSEFTLTAEYGNRPLKKIKIDNERLGINDGNAFRAGFEYRTAVALRAGVAIDNYAKFAKPRSKNPASLMVLTAGIGVPAGPVKLDFAAEYGRTTIKYQPAGETQNYKQSSDVLRVGINATYAWDMFPRMRIK